MAGVEEYEQLENILNCPVCFEIPKSSPIHQCDRGHHVCDTCYKKLKDRKCPMCTAPFYGTRNFMAEELIKILPFLSIERSSAALPSAPPSVQTNEPEVRIKSAPPLCRGLFPCPFDRCNKNVGAGRMLKHIRDNHGEFLTEVSAQNKYNDEWGFEYALNSLYVEAVRIANMGLFFYVMDLDENGLLRATVQMVASEEVAAMFRFKMKILDGKKESKISFKDRVFSCRDYVHDLAYNGHCLEFDINKFSHLQQHNGTLLCSISIIDGRQ